MRKKTFFTDMSLAKGGGAGGNGVREIFFSQNVLKCKMFSEVFVGYK